MKLSVKLLFSIISGLLVLCSFFPFFAVRENPPEGPTAWTTFSGWSFFFTQHSIFSFLFFLPAILALLFYITKPNQYLSMIFMLNDDPHLFFEERLFLFSTAVSGIGLLLSVIMPFRAASIIEGSIMSSLEDVTAVPHVGFFLTAALYLAATVISIISLKAKRK